MDAPGPGTAAGDRVRASAAAAGSQPSERPDGLEFTCNWKVCQRSKPCYRAAVSPERCSSGACLGGQLSTRSRCSPLLQPPFLLATAPKAPEHCPAGALTWCPVCSHLCPIPRPSPATSGTQPAPRPVHVWPVSHPEPCRSCLTPRGCECPGGAWVSLGGAAPLRQTGNASGPWGAPEEPGQRGEAWRELWSSAVIRGEIITAVQETLAPRGHGCGGQGMGKEPAGVWGAGAWGPLSPAQRVGALRGATAGSGVPQVPGSPPHVAPAPLHREQRDRLPGARGSAPFDRCQHRQVFTSQLELQGRSCPGSSPESCPQGAGLLVPSGQAWARGGLRRSLLRIKR